jgi:hypothetical protein
MAEQRDAEKFGLSRNLVIDIDPAFPWQITSLDGYGANLQLVKDRQWGLGRQRNPERCGGDL